MRIAVIGSGISGLATAHILGPHHDVVVFEAADRLGGHTNTVSVNDNQLGKIGIDTGFIVHNDRNYPQLGQLFDELDIETQESEMSFSVTDQPSGISYRATGLNTMFARRSNAFKSRFWRMLADIPRFYRGANDFLLNPNVNTTTREFLTEREYSQAFIDLHLVPMGASVWSANPNEFLDFPAASLFRFLANHGLLSIGDRPQWRTVTGGSQRYVDAIDERFGGEVRLNTAISAVTRPDNGSKAKGAQPNKGVQVRSGSETEEFDRVVLACHSDQSLKILADPTKAETEILSAIRYQPNHATLHTDQSIMPSASKAWAAWNYHRFAETNSNASLTYDLTNLQRLGTSEKYLVSLNSIDRIDPNKVLYQTEYSHPVFDLPAIRAQRRLDDINGVNNTFYCGAWQSFGFHEDGMASAVRVCAQLGVEW